MSDAVVEFDEMDVSGLVEELTPTQVQIAFRKALRELSIPHSVNSDATTHFDDEVDYEYFQSEQFCHVYERYLQEAAIEVALNSLVREGLVEKVWLDHDVCFGYRLVNDLP